LLSLIHVLEWRAAVHPGAIALSDQQGAELTYAGLADAVDRSAAGFAAAGIGPGDGASPIRPELLQRAVAELGCRFRQNYASSETGPLPITSLPPEDHDPARGRLSTAGRPSLGWEVRLGERGEIQVRGAAPLPGYWNDPEATARSLTADGFYRTGDVGTLDADGYLTIVDRLSDLVITGGENVYPAEVEAVLAGHPAVADVAVIGIPDERWGETVHAVVVLPRNATGKVLRAALRQPFWAGRDRQVS
jgi:acyl-CoA synthetase (AMP-forming)/AMP-acid ligase II